MTRPILAGCLWLPLDQYDAETLIERFTIDYRPLGKEAHAVPAYVLADGWIGVPRQIGLKSISNDFEDGRAYGTPVEFPRKPTLKPEQEPFVAAMLAAARDPHPDFMAYAATGKGKTVCSLAVAAELGVTAIALVDQERLMEQWIERAQEHLGLDGDIPVKEIMKGKGRDIGIVQGPRCNYDGKKLVVAMIQSLTQNTYPEEFYDYFGTVMVDECHVAGAPTFSQTLLMFSAIVRFGVSATPERPDALKKLLTWNLGTVEAHMGTRHQKSRVYFAESDTVVSWYANKAKVAGRYLAELSENGARNLLLAEAIEFLWKTDRELLVISDRVEQLCNLMALCRARGIPNEQMGLYARSRVEWRYVLNPTPPRNPPYWERGTQFSPVHLAPVQVRTNKRDLEQCINEARIIFATYGMFEKGVDVPRLSGGVDCTPRSKATQVHGRILRTAGGKKVPIWITVRDPMSFRAEYQFLSRLDDYVNSNAEVYLWNPEKGILREDADVLASDVRRRIAELKPQKIITRLDGSYTLATPTTLSVSAALPANRTGRIIRSRRASSAMDSSRPARSAR